MSLYNVKKTNDSKIDMQLPGENRKRGRNYEPGDMCVYHVAKPQAEYTPGTKMYKCINECDGYKKCDSRFDVKSTGLAVDEYLKIISERVNKGEVKPTINLLV